jgi:hypothetical protein
LDDEKSGRGFFVDIVDDGMSLFCMPKFMLPEGVEVPENLKEGEAFQTMATIILGKGGKAELIEVDGVAIPGYEKRGSKGKKMAEREYEEEGEMEEGGEREGFVAEVMRRGAGPMM